MLSVFKIEEVYFLEIFIHKYWYRRKKRLTQNVKSAKNRVDLMRSNDIIVKNLSKYIPNCRNAISNSALDYDAMWCDRLYTQNVQYSLHKQIRDFNRDVTLPRTSQWQILGWILSVTRAISRKKGIIIFT